MTTIQMDSGLGWTGTVTLGAPSLAQVALVNGIGSVNAQDVPTALKLGWRIGPREPWPAVQVFHMTIPSYGAWPANGTVTFPDGSTTTTTSGTALIPILWLNWARQNGWTGTPGYGNDGI